MNDIVTLLKPRVWSLMNRCLSKKSDGGWPFKLLLFGLIGTFFWGGIFVVSLRVLGYFKGIEELGDLLAYKLLSMALLTFFSLLIFSSIITSLSKLYLSRDLPLVHAMPVSSRNIFFARWIESTVDSSWMVVVYTAPVFISYGIAYKTGFFFYGNVMLSLLSLSIIASGIGAVLVMVAVVFIPANRMKTVFIFIGLCCFLILFFAFRFLRPERLVDPEVFANALIYLKALKTPLPGYLPSTWVYDILTTALSGQLSAGLLHVMLLVSCTGFMICLVVILADMVYFTGLSKSRTAAVRLFKHREIGAAFFRFLPRQVAAFVRKEIKIFLRDQTQWTQVILIGALIVVYIYNFKVLPLEKAPIKTFYLQNLLSFLNMGLAGFVLIAVTARFAYPAVSTEQEAIWIVRSVPISLGNYLWIKFFIYFIPLLGLTELLIIATNILLKVTPFMMALSTVNVLFMVPGIVSMGIGFGAGYPNFKSENPAQAVTGLGGLLFMMACAGYLGAVIILEAGPVYSLFMANITQKALANLEWAWIVGSFALVFLISILVITLPMKFGERRLAKILA